MRGIAASGYLRAFFKSKLIDSFDTLHGSSAGACAAAYFLAQQPEEGRKIFDDISTRKVVNPFRFLSQPCMVDTDYIVDEVIGKKQCLNIDKIVSEPGVLNIVTTSIVDSRPVVHTNFENKEQVLRALKATLRVPGPFETGIEIDGSRHLDGGMVAPIPIFSAIDSRATHILVLCTQRVQDYGSSDIKIFFEGQILGLLYGNKLKNAYVAAQTVANRNWEFSCDPSIKADILVRPAFGTYCDWCTIDKKTLGKVEKESYSIASEYLSGTRTQNTE